MITKKERYENIIAWFQKNMPVAETELHYDNHYQLMIAVILSSIFGYAILMVTTIDGDKEYKIKTLSSYNTLKRRKSFDKFKGNYVYIKDGYLYIPDSEVEAVNILLLTLDEDSDEMSECKDPNLGCVSIWDREIKVADKILTPIIQQTLQEISMRFNIPIDENSNLDVNVKTQEK